jgi:hypothetical protein
MESVKFHAFNLKESELLTGRDDYPQWERRMDIALQMIWLDEMCGVDFVTSVTSQDGLPTPPTPPASNKDIPGSEKAFRMWNHLDVTIASGIQLSVSDGLRQQLSIFVKSKEPGRAWRAWSHLRRTYGVGGDHLAYSLARKLMGCVLESGEKMSSLFERMWPMYLQLQEHKLSEEAFFLACMLSRFPSELHAYRDSLWTLPSLPSPAEVRSAVSKIDNVTEADAEQASTALIAPQQASDYMVPPPHWGNHCHPDLIAFYAHCSSNGSTVCCN